jgi:hypothetical protein
MLPNLLVMLPNPDFILEISLLLLATALGNAPWTPTGEMGFICLEFAGDDVGAELHKEYTQNKIRTVRTIIHVFIVRLWYLYFYLLFYFLQKNKLPLKII